MTETALGDLALQIARLEGKLDGYQQSVKVEMLSYDRRLEESTLDRRDIHREVDGLKIWRAWMTGIGSGIAAVLALVSAYAALHAAGARF